MFPPGISPVLLMPMFFVAEMAFVMSASVRRLSCRVCMPQFVRCILTTAFVESPSLRRRYRTTTLRAYAFVRSTLQKPALCRLTSNLCLFLLGFVTTTLPRVQLQVIKALNESSVDSDSEDGIEDSEKTETESEVSRSTAPPPQKPQSLLEQMQPDQRARYDSSITFWEKQRYSLAPISYSGVDSASATPSSTPKVSRKKRRGSAPTMGIGEAVAADSTFGLVKSGLIVGDYLLVTPKDNAVERTLELFKPPVEEKSLEEASAGGEEVISIKEDADDDGDAEEDGWLRWIRGWCANYHTFVGYFVDAFHPDSAPTFDLSSKAYTGIIHSLLAWMCCHPIFNWDPAEEANVAAVLRRDASLVMPVLKIVFESCNALDKGQIVVLFDLLQNWMPIVTDHVKASSPPDAGKIFDEAYFLGIMRQLLELDHYATTQHVLSLLYNNCGVFFTPSARLALFKLLVEEGFLRLFLHWSPDVRSMYSKVIYDRFAASWIDDRAFAEMKSKVLAMVESVRSAEGRTRISEHGVMHFRPDSPKPKSSKRRRKSNSSKPPADIPLTKSAEILPPSGVPDFSLHRSLDSIRRSTEIQRVPERKSLDEGARPKRQATSLEPPRAGALHVSTEIPVVEPAFVPADMLPYCAAAIKQFDDSVAESDRRGEPIEKLVFQDSTGLEKWLEKWLHS